MFSYVTVIHCFLTNYPPSVVALNSSLFLFLLVLWGHWAQLGSLAWNMSWSCKHWWLRLEPSEGSAALDVLDSFLTCLAPHCSLTSLFSFSPHPISSLHVVWPFMVVSAWSIYRLQLFWQQTEGIYKTLHFQIQVTFTRMILEYSSEWTNSVNVQSNLL